MADSLLCRKLHVIDESSSSERNSFGLWFWAVSCWSSPSGGRASSVAVFLVVVLASSFGNASPSRLGAPVTRIEYDFVVEPVPVVFVLALRVDIRAKDET